MVAECLPPLNLLALSQTCNSLKTMLDVYTEAVLPKTVAKEVAGKPLPPHHWDSREEASIEKDFKTVHLPGPRGDLSEEDSQRLEFLCMLERDGQLSEQRLVCSRCVQTHERSLFSSQARQKEPTKRYCIGHEGRVQICPYQELSYANVTEWTPYYSYGPCYHENGNWRIRYTDGGRLTLYLYRSRLLGVPLDKIRWPDIMKVLSRCLPFCPHTHSSDKDFLDRIHYHDHSNHLGMCAECPAHDQPDEYDESSYVGHHNCVTCGAWIKISIAEERRHKTVIQISVHRDLGPLSTKPTDPQWIANVTVPLESLDSSGQRMAGVEYDPSQENIR